MTSSLVCVLSYAPLQRRWGTIDHMLALLVLDELKMLQSGDDVVCLDGRHVAQAFDADAAFVIPQHLQSSYSALTMACIIGRPK